MNSSECMVRKSDSQELIEELGVKCRRPGSRMFDINKILVIN